MKKLLGFLYSILFIALVAVTVAALYLWANPVFYFYLFNLVFAFCYGTLGIKNRLTFWCYNNMICVDQGWQVLFAPLLNLGVRTQHKFGWADETASSVVGKNLSATGELRWRIIEWVLSIALSLGRPHSLKAIEHDEGAGF